VVNEADARDHSTAITDVRRYRRSLPVASRERSRLRLQSATT